MKNEKIEYQHNEPTKANIYLLFDDITNESASRVCEWILNCNFSSQDKPDILNLIVNSTGGSLSDAYAIIDVMASSIIPIRTIGLGCVQSAGLMIFLAGTKGQRILTPNTSIMSHQYSWGSTGKHGELIAITKEYELIYNRMMNHYKKHTKLSESAIKKYLLPSEDVYLSAEDALKFKICDKISLI